MKPTIQAGDGTVTLINVFTVEPENQQKLVELLKEGTESFFSKLPGFISSSVHKSKDGRRAINYAQWRSARDIEAFRGMRHTSALRYSADDPSATLIVVSEDGPVSVIRNGEVLARPVERPPA